MSATRQNGSALERGLTYAIGALSLLLIAVVVNSFLHSDENPFNPIAAAAERTLHSPGGHFSIEATYSSPSLPQPMTASGDGVFNSATGRSEVSLTVESPQVGSIWIDAIGDGTTVYMRGDQISQLPEGKLWLAVQPLLGHSEEEAILGEGAESSLQMMRAVGGGAEELGSEQVGGVPTQGYRSSIDLSRYADLLRAEGKDELADQYEKVASLMPTPVVVEAWLDDKGIVRRSRTIMTLPTSPGQPEMTIDMSIELSRLGARPHIPLPDPSTVYDATPALEQQLDSAESDF